MSSSKAPPRNVPPPAGGATKGSAYSRFIPREEMGSFAAWAPDDISGGATAPASGVQRPAAAPERSPAEELVRQVHAARQSGYQDGYRDGLAALDGFKQSYAAQITAQIGTLVESLGAQFDALQQEMARTLAASATALARQMVRSELAVRPELVAGVAEEAVKTLLLSARHIAVRVHPDDHPLVAQGAGDTLAARGARLVADAAVQRGGCRVESDIGIIDASIESRWQRAAAALGGEQPWNAQARAQP